jgi:diguanylate cyclase (GGDEF)-like protein
MSSSVRIERVESALRPAGSGITQELPLVSGELRAALREDQAKVRGEVILWQRWVRYIALGAMVLLTVVFSTTVQTALLPLGIIAAAYVFVVLGTASMLRRGKAVFLHEWFPSFLVIADIGALAGFCYLTSTPEQFPRILLLGFLSMQLGVFYFGRRQGWLAVSLTAIAYVLFALGVPPFIYGPRPPAVSVAFNVILFGIISTVLIYTLGSFRERMDALRMYCKIAERGEGALLPELGVERWPDDLTLLARSFQSMHARLSEQLGSDPLTACMNRRSLESRLNSDLRQARRRASTVAVAAIDVDHFKDINDSRGHPIGDLVLQQIAGIMQETARDTDAVARAGGDEFVIILPDTSWQGALTFAERLREQVEQFTFGPPAAPMRVTVSIGVALARDTDPATTEWLLGEADAALYRAKTAGRNRVYS